MVPPLQADSVPLREDGHGGFRGRPNIYSGGPLDLGV